MIFKIKIVSMITPIIIMKIFKSKHVLVGCMVYICFISKKKLVTDQQISEVLHFSIFARPAKQWHVDRTERERESREAERERGRRAASERAGKWESQAPGPRGFQHGFSGISHPQSPLILTLVTVQQLG